MSMHPYRGVEVYSLICPHSRTTAILGRNRAHGFDAAMKICLSGSTLTHGDTFKLNERSPFSTAGAALKFAKGIIDQHGGENRMPSWQRWRQVHHTDRQGGSGYATDSRPEQLYKADMTKIVLKLNEPVDVALRRFRREIQKTGLIQELRARCFYEKPTAERKRKLASAVSRQRARIRRATPPKKLY